MSSELLLALFSFGQQRCHDLIISFPPINPFCFIKLSILLSTILRLMCFLCIWVELKIKCFISIVFVEIFFLFLYVNWTVCKEKPTSYYKLSANSFLHYPKDCLMFRGDLLLAGIPAHSIDRMRLCVSHLVVYNGGRFFASRFSSSIRQFE